MLEHLEIRNFALIENLCVDFSEGFNVITGETGSGKSIILGALGLLMGEKADTGAVRSGADEIVIDMRYCRGFPSAAWSRRTESSTSGAPSRRTEEDR